MSAPTPESYWVTPRVLAGKYPGAKLDRDAVSKVAALVDAGVRTFVDLTEDGELLPYARLLPRDAAHHRIAVRDVSCPSVAQVREALDLVESASDRGIVYVHCRGGCGRTGVVIGCYLIERGLRPDEALARTHELMRALWSKPCPETPEQIEMVRQWKSRRGGTWQDSSVVREVAAEVAERLEERARNGGGLSVLGERADLEPAFVRALDARFPGLAEKDRRLEIPGWPAAGNVDILVRKAPSASSLLLAAELKWCAADKLYEAIWDLFKMAPLAGRGDVDAAYLATGASEEVWETSRCSDLFETSVQTPLDLCARRFTARSRRLMWDDLLEGGYDRFPAWVPAQIRTNVAAAVEMRTRNEAWELRIVRVTPVGTDRLEFRDGWPNGDRPSDAKRPVAPDVIN